MAFNFNWSPLIADTSRARDMLTSALNKSPKPPIIVDDIVVTDLNLGTVAPELEILEIGDLAEDRFRGIFKLAYAGDAFLTLQTQVQANPLNTFLSTSSSFASPKPLAADDGLTIPLQITLSDFKLSGFVILVFSRQKGLTLVFRNDPVESLKVSSTFDSIPFIRDYLQKVIESQLRNLFVDDLPAIIHRLSLKLWCSENRDGDQSQPNSEKRAPPFVFPPNPAKSQAERPTQDGDEDQDLFDPGPQFSQKNILHLAFLQEANNTLLLDTLSIPDTIYRAATFSQRPERSSYFANIGLSRVHSTASLPSVISFASDSEPSPSSHTLTPPSSHTSAGMSRARSSRQRKRRVVDLRSQPSEPASSATKSSKPLPPARDVHCGNNNQEALPLPTLTPPIQPTGPMMTPEHLIRDLSHSDLLEACDDVPPPSYSEHPDLMESSYLCPIGKDVPASVSSKPTAGNGQPSSPLSTFRPSIPAFHPPFLRPAALPLMMSSTGHILRKPRPAIFSQPTILRTTSR